MIVINIVNLKTYQFVRLKVHTVHLIRVTWIGHLIGKHRKEGVKAVGENFWLTSNWLSLINWLPVDWSDREY